MELTPEQAEEIKKQIINQINSTFPEDKKQESIQRINSMNSSELVGFLEQNNLIKNFSGDSEKQCIFCSILSGQIPSTKISEDEDSVAILEINPLSEGHTLIIPKMHTDIISEKTKEFAEKIKEKLKESLNPKEIVSENNELFGHAVINLIPVYGDSLETERKKSSPEELKELKERIISGKNPEEDIQKAQPEKEIIPEDTIIPKRIP